MEKKIKYLECTYDVWDEALLKANLNNPKKKPAKYKVARKFKNLY